MYDAVTFNQRGDFSNTFKFFERMKGLANLSIFDKYGRKGVQSLAALTPKKTGKTSQSWSYEIQRNNGVISIVWNNDNFNKNVNIAILIQYGHGTKQGSYVQGIDYVNPAIKPVFDEMAVELWKEVTK